MLLKKSRNCNFKMNLKRVVEKWKYKFVVLHHIKMDMQIFEWNCNYNVMWLVKNWSERNKSKINFIAEINI